MLGASGNLLGPAVSISGHRDVIAALEHASNKIGNSDRFMEPAAEEMLRFMRDHYLSGQRLRKRSGNLYDSWHSEKREQDHWVLTPGPATDMPYARVHEYGLVQFHQFVRGYTTRSGREVEPYFRDMFIPETRYVSDTVTYSKPFVLDVIEEELNKALRESGVAD